jgi:ActR/RegA family two-component response regulator
MSHDPKTILPRVLIVDNEEQIVELYQEFMDVWGYSAVIAEGVGNDLLEDARRKAREARCQMALVDMRLADNFDDEDTSGLSLIKDLKPAETIIISGFGTLDLALETVKNRGAADFFEKSDDPDKLKTKMDKVSGEICAARKDTIIGPPDILELTMRTLFDPAKHIPAEAHDQVLDVLVCLFPKARVLRLEKMSSAIGSSDFSTAPRPRSVVLRVYEDDLQPMIVKIARREKIQKEVENFEKYIRGRLVGKHNPVLEGHVELWDIGGIKLSYVGSIEETFANFVSTQPIEKITQSLENFFWQTWSGHYKNAKGRLNSSLLSLYCEVWERDWVNRAHNYILPDASDLMPLHLWEMARHHDPLDWLKVMIQNEGSEHDPSMVEATCTAITHGDLHADNLLIDDTHHGWVVDFERTGEGHVLQDFIELESDIITRIACAREEFPAFYHFCVAIVSTDSLEEPPHETSSREDEETRKLLETIAAIRSLAVRCTQITDLRQYLLGLYFNTIFRATIAVREQKQIKDLRAWMLASVLCHRLAHWNQPWPPEEWKTTS